MYKIAICDDDRDYRKNIQQIITQEGVIENRELSFHEYDSGEALLKEAALLHHLIFVDIRMPGMDGNKTAELLRKSNDKAVLVYCSGFFEPTPEGINIGQPFRYILKDMYSNNLKKEIRQILLEMQRRVKVHIVTVTEAGKLLQIPINELLYISVAKRGSYLYLEQQERIVEIRCRESIKELYCQLEEQGFEYAHNSYIVNLEKVVSFERTVLRLRGGVQLNISRSKKTQFEEHFMKFLCGRNNK